jgi:RNA polymerase sigma factor (sigma-70 family)
MTDHQVIEHLQNNHYSHAVKGLYGLLPSIKKYIVANNGNSEDAKDIFQDALVILYKKVQAGGFVLTVPLKTYLLAVVKNCWLQELRRRNKFPATEQANDIEEIVINEEEGFATAQAAFNLLGEKCRQLLMLFYFRKQSFKDIAAALSFSDENVAKNQKYRCMQKAKENYLTLSNNGNNG